MSTINPNFVPQSFVNQQTGDLKVDKTLAGDVQAGVQARLDKLPPVGDRELLALVANLAPGDVDTPAKLAETLDRYEAAARKVSDWSDALPFTGDISKFLARAMIEFSGQQRQQAADDRQMARAQAKAELLEQAAKQDKAGDQMMSGAITNAIVGGLGAGLSFLGAMKSLKGQGTELKNMAQASRQMAAASKTMDNFAEASQDATKGASATGKAGRTGGTEIDVELKVGVTRPRSNAVTERPTLGGDGATGGTTGPNALGSGSKPQNAMKDSDAAIAKANTSSQAKDDLAARTDGAGRPRSDAVTERPASGPGSLNGNRPRSDAVTERPAFGPGSLAEGRPRSNAVSGGDAPFRENAPDPKAVGGTKPEPPTAMDAVRAKTAKETAEKNFTLADKRAIIAQTQGQAADAIGNMFRSVGAGVDGAMQGQAKKTEAEGSKDAADSQYWQQVADGKKEIQDSMSEMMKQITSFIKEIQDTEVEAMRAITRG